MRLDQILVARGLARSRTLAAELVKSGRVLVNGVIIYKTSARFPLDNLALEVLPSPISKFVSRGGLKLEAALEELELSVGGLRALDVGISTGGFTDCLLHKGVKEVVGLDVGHGQLASKIKDDPRVVSHEGVNFRNLSPEFTSNLGLFDLIVIDVSFISLENILPRVRALLQKDAVVLALVKPQFEAGPRGTDKGVVRDKRIHEEVETKIRELIASLGYRVRRYFECQPTGGEGNQEFFVFFDACVDDQRLREST